jgi:hypothetical protein
MIKNFLLFFNKKQFEPIFLTGFPAGRQVWQFSLYQFLGSAQTPMIILTFPRWLVDSSSDFTRSNPIMSFLTNFIYHFDGSRAR